MEGAELGAASTEANEAQLCSKDDDGGGKSLKSREGKERMSPQPTVEGF